MLACGYWELLDTRPQRLAEVERLRALIAPHEDVDRKRELWDAEEHIAVTDRIALRAMQTAVAAYEQALDHVPDCAEARQGLHEIYAREVTRAKVHRDDVDRAYFEELARRHAPPTADGGRENGLLALCSDEPLQVAILRFESVQRRVVLKEVSDHITSPNTLPLPTGVYVASVRGVAARYPFVITASAETTVTMDPRATTCGVGEIFVAAGPSLVSLWSEELRVVEIPAFFIDELPVTYAAYSEFLSDLFRRDAHAAERHLPTGDDDEPYLAWNGDKLVPTRRAILGATLDESRAWPVFGVSFESAETFARWRSQRSGLGYRLPTSKEWEKAARGIDGRRYPWGDVFDATFCKMRQSRDGRPRPEPVGTFVIDESPYGVRDMAGGIAEWTMGTDGSTAGQLAIAKGGAWCDWETECDLGIQRSYRSTDHASRVGFRLMREA
jgi:serine/threonine-protein kinase